MGKELETVDLLLKSYGYKAKDMELGVRTYTNSFSNHITVIKGEHHNKEIWHVYKELPPIHEFKYIGSTISELKEYLELNHTISNESNVKYPSSKKLKEC